MNQNCRDLANAGLYLCALILIAGSVAYASASAVGEGPALVSAATPGNASAPPTRIREVVSGAREIRAALAKPIPRPEPLPPITAKLAYGHLKPGAAAHVSARQRMPARDQAGHNAMARDVSFNFRASSAVAPELHKVY